MEALSYLSGRRPEPGRAGREIIQGAGIYFLRALGSSAT